MPSAPKQEESENVTRSSTTSPTHDASLGDAFNLLQGLFDDLKRKNAHLELGIVSQRARYEGRLSEATKVADEETVRRLLAEQKLRELAEERDALAVRLQEEKRKAESEKRKRKAQRQAFSALIQLKEEEEEEEDIGFGPASGRDSDVTMAASSSSRDSPTVRHRIRKPNPKYTLGQPGYTRSKPQRRA